MKNLQISEILRFSEIRGYHAKQAFHKDGKVFLKKLAAEIGMEQGTFKIRSCLGGDGVTGEVILHGDSLYVDLHHNGQTQIMFRSCNGKTDYTGGRNNWAKLSDFNDESNAQYVLHRMREAAGLLETETA